MQGTKEIKRRIKSIKNTKKITKAMELVAASKMKRAVSSALASRLYAEYSWDILTSISRNVEEITHPLFNERPVKNTLLILITSNRGLCGAYNAQVIKKVLALLKTNGGKNIEVVTVGKKGDAAMRRVGKKVIAAFPDLSGNFILRDVLPISTLAVNEYASGRYDRVLVAYTDFKSAMSQTPNIKQIVPVSKTELKEFISELETVQGDEYETAAQNIEAEKGRTLDLEKGSTLKSPVNYLIEGDKNALLGSLAEKIVRMQIYQMLLESNASEQSSRMVAMKNASDAAGEMIEDLTLVFNKARQAGITQEISEISAGMASIS